jgi:hypothetical protein
MRSFIVFASFDNVERTIQSPLKRSDAEICKGKQFRVANLARLGGRVSDLGNI